MYFCTTIMINSGDNLKQFNNQVFYQSDDERYELNDFGFLASAKFNNCQILYNFPCVDSCVFQFSQFNGIYKRKGVISSSVFKSCLITDSQITKVDLIDLHFKNCTLKNVCLGGSYLERCSFKNTIYRHPLVTTATGPQPTGDPLIIKDVKVWNSNLNQYITAEDWSHFLFLMKEDKDFCSANRQT